MGLLPLRDKGGMAGPGMKRGGNSVGSDLCSEHDDEKNSGSIRPNEYALNYISTHLHLRSPGPFETEAAWLSCPRVSFLVL
jgi:hypothetical protein